MHEKSFHTGYTLFARSPRCTTIFDSIKYNMIYGKWPWETNRQSGKVIWKRRRKEKVRLLKFFFFSSLDLLMCGKCVCFLLDAQRMVVVTFVVGSQQSTETLILSSRAIFGQKRAAGASLFTVAPPEQKQSAGGSSSQTQAHRRPVLNHSTII